MFVKVLFDIYYIGVTNRTRLLYIFKISYLALNIFVSLAYTCIMTMLPFLWSLGFINFHRKYFYKKVELKIVQYFPKSEVIAGAINSLAVH